MSNPPQRARRPFGKPGSPGFLAACATLAMAWMSNLSNGAAAATPDLSKLPSPTSARIDFVRDIQPIFEEKCWRCHGPERPKSHFRLDNRESALKGGDNGVAIIPGNSAASPLVQYVAGLVPDMEMPPAGKGEPLTAEQIARLRAWIDQGVTWNTNAAAPLSFSASPAFGGFAVQGDHRKFREIEGVREGFRSGLGHFSLQEQLAPDARVSVEGHALFPDDDIALKLRVQKDDLGFIRAGFEHWRRYYDNTGGYYHPATVPSFDLNRDLELDLGRAWVDFGMTRPGLPQVVLGYEYQFRDGAKSTLERGPVNGKNIYPAFALIDESTHIVKLDLTYELREWRLEDNARFELHDAANRRVDVLGVGPALNPDVVVRRDEGFHSIEGMNAFRAQRQVQDWWLTSAGYFYSKFGSDYTLNLSTVDAAAMPTAGNFWSADRIELIRETHIFDLANQLLPGEKFNVSLGLQGEWQRQEGFGPLELDQGDPNVPQLFLLQPAKVHSDLDRLRATESLGLRYSGLPFSVLFADGRFEQEGLSQFEQETGDVPEAFLRDTDATSDRRDLRIGFNTSPWRWMALTAHFRKRDSLTDYDHQHRFVLEGDGYSAFLRHREIHSDEAQAKLSFRPSLWLQLALTYQDVTGDFYTSADALPGGLSPGGELLAGTYRQKSYGASASFTRIPRLTLSGAFTYANARTATARHGALAVTPYDGDVFTFTGTAAYALAKATQLQLAYAWSTADYGQSNYDGVPLGLNYTRHGVAFGLGHRLSPAVSANFSYKYYSYAEPSTGGFNDYTAHGVFLTVNYKWL